MNDSLRAVRHRMSSSRCVFRGLSLHRDPRHPYHGVPSQGPSALGPNRIKQSPIQTFDSGLRQQHRELL